MANVVQPDLVREFLALGVGDINACFHCGNCTAVCRLTERDTVFPRQVIRYAQLGLKDRLAAAPEPWLCYYCGQCTTTCPRQAGPGEFMAAARRYAIAAADPTGLARAMFRHPAITVAVTLFLAVLMGFFLLSVHPHREFSHWLFQWIPYTAIHDLGLVVSGLLGLLLVFSVTTVARRLGSGLGGVRAILRIPWSRQWQAWKRLGQELLTMRRHAQCEAPGGASLPAYLSPRAVHGSIMWGFLGLAGATTWDFIVVYLLGIPFFLPARVLGTMAGLVMLFGVAVSLYQRSRHRAPPYDHSVTSDWWLLVFLLVLAVTGFWLEVVVTLRLQGAIHEVMLLLHTVMAMELILLAALTKLAHVIYRPLALWIYFLKTTPAAPNSNP